MLLPKESLRRFQSKLSEISTLRCNRRRLGSAELDRWGPVVEDHIDHLENSAGSDRTSMKQTTSEHLGPKSLLVLQYTPGLTCKKEKMK